MQASTHKPQNVRKDVIYFSLYVVFIVAVLVTAYRFVNPAPPDHIVMMAGDGEGDYLNYAKAYQAEIKDEGIRVDIRKSSGTVENLKALQDPTSDADVGFVIDGLASSEQDPDLVSLGSLYYEPIWIFYRGSRELTRLSQLQGLKISLGEHGSGTEALALRLLETAGVTDSGHAFQFMTWDAAEESLRAGRVDAAFFVATPEDPQIEELIADSSIRLMSLDQAEALTKHLPFLHELKLPHGAINLKQNLPAHDTQMLAATTTLVAKEDLHPALIYLLLKAATQIHNEPGIFESKGEFPTDKDYELPMADAAKQYYKSGTPFWQKHLPFWLAILVDRFILVGLPLIALIYPMIKAVPRFFQWRTKNKIYKRYGELKYLETQILNEVNHEQYQAHLRQLDVIEDRVNDMKLPLDFSEHVYVLREHIDLVRRSLQRDLENDRKGKA
jgi:TRAP transporter TAXI family solute receptor